MKQYIVPAIAVIALLVGLWALHGPIGLKSNGNGNFGATAAGNLLAENYIPYILYNGGYNSAKDINTTGGFTVGSSGTTFAKQIGTTCNLIGTDGSQTASTSKAYDCAVTGVTASDIVFAQLATTTTATINCPGWWITAAKASSTAGFVTVILANSACGAAVPSVTSVGSSTKIWAFQ